MRPRRRTEGLHRRTLPLAILGIAACGGADGAPDAEAFIVTDSAGVQMVSNTAPPSGSGATWTVDPEPVVQIGVEGASELLFGRISRARRRADDHLAVVDGMTREIAIVDSSGDLLYTVGGEGQGPGEFERTPAIAWSEEGMLTAFDPVSARLSWFGEGGELVRERSLTSALSDVLVVNGRWRISETGALLGTVTYMDRIPEGTQGRVQLLSVPADADTVIEMGEYPAVRAIHESGWMVTSGFAHVPVAAFAREGDRAYLAASPTWDVRQFDAGDGTLARITRASVARTPVTQELIEAERQLWTERAGSNRPASTYLEVLDEFEVPDSLPGISSMQVDEVGNLWLGRRTTLERGSESDYVVVDSSGRWIANVVVPEGLGYVRDITSDAIVTSATGPVGEPVVNVYAVRR